VNRTPTMMTMMITGKRMSMLTNMKGNTFKSTDPTVLQSTYLGREKYQCRIAPAFDFLPNRRGFSDSARIRVF
jgi:hypothetical protein